MQSADDRRQAVALFRYSLIREAADPVLSARQRDAPSPGGAPVLPDALTVRLRQGVGTPDAGRRLPNPRPLAACPTGARFPPLATHAAGKRPAGPEPQPHPRLRMRVGAGPASDRLSAPGRHQPGVGWGFHRKVCATPALPLGAFGPPSPGHAPSGTSDSRRRR